MTWMRDLGELGGNIDAPQPTAQNNSWDYVLLADTPCPGVATVDIEIDTGIDVQKPRGQKKAYTVDNGEPPARVKITIELLPSEVERFTKSIMPIIRPGGAKKGRDPMNFGHPLGTMWGISKIIVDKISAPSPKSGMAMSITLDCLEWAPAPKKVKTTGKPQTSKTTKGGSAPKPEPPGNPYEKVYQDGLARGVDFSGLVP